MTSERSTFDPDALPAPVTGVARGGRGTGTALDDTQVYDVAEFTAASGEAADASQPPPVVAAEQRAPAPVVAPVRQSAPRVAAGRRTSDDRKPRVGAPVAGFVGFALAAGLAILLGASLGGNSAPGAANGDATFAAPATDVPAETEAADDDDEGGDKGKENKGCNGNGRGNCDDD